MIQAGELRIGNLAERDGNLLKVIRISKDGIVNYDLIKKSQGIHVNSGNVVAIKLTEEWLIKLGFNKLNNSNEWYVIKQNDFELSIHLSGNEICFGSGNVFFKGNFKHIHTIQNLYFALTGKELSYDPSRTA